MTNMDPMHLVLLPPIPQPATYSAVKAAYNSSLLHALRTLKDSNSGRVVLDIALPCPHLHEQSSQLRSKLYAQTQEVIANVYKLVCVIAAQHDIEVADVDGDSVDVRLLLVAYPRDGILGTESDSRLSGWVGPVIELGTLATCGRAWRTVWSVETEPGEILLKNFKSKYSGSSCNYQKLQGGTVQVETSASYPTVTTRKSCHSVALGGTFDHLHIGHKLLLTMTAFALDPPSGHGKEERVFTCGMTAADLLAKKKYAELLQSWRKRTDHTHRFMRGILLFSPQGDRLESMEEIQKPGPNGHALIIRIPCTLSTLEFRYVEIWDPFGPTITDPEIDTLVVSGETRSGGKMVNDKRSEVSMSALEIFEVDVLDGEEEQDISKPAQADNFTAKLSSSEIRKVQAEKLKGRAKV